LIGPSFVTVTRRPTPARLLVILPICGHTPERRSRWADTPDACGPFFPATIVQAGIADPFPPRQHQDQAKRPEGHFEAVEISPHCPVIWPTWHQSLTPYTVGRHDCVLNGHTSSRDQS